MVRGAPPLDPAASPSLPFARCTPGEGRDQGSSRAGAAILSGGLQGAAHLLSRAPGKQSIIMHSGRISYFAHDYVAEAERNASALSVSLTEL